MQILEQISNRFFNEMSDEVNLRDISSEERIDVAVRYYFYFLIYSFIGWIWETAYTSLDTGRLQERGFLHIPILPIYGFSIIFIIAFFYDRKFTRSQIFIGSACITSIMEFCTSYVLERVFHKTWWNYSNMRFQIQGRICLLATIGFGIASLIIVEFIHPRIKKMVYVLLENKYSKKFCFITLVLIVLDLSVTVVQLVR